MTIESEAINAIASLARDLGRAEMRIRELESERRPVPPVADSSDVVEHRQRAEELQAELEEYRKHGTVEQLRADLEAIRTERDEARSDARAYQDALGVPPDLAAERVDRWRDSLQQVSEGITEARSEIARARAKLNHRKWLIAALVELCGSNGIEVEAREIAGDSLEE